MTKYIFCKEKFVARMIEKRLIKIGAIDCEGAYVHARYDAYNQTNTYNWVNNCDGKICTFDGISLRCGAYVINRSWCIEVEDDN